jgi:mRNA interferase HigB
MKVHLIKQQTIIEFATKHASSKSAFDNWLTLVKNADWNKPVDIQNTFSTADLIGNGSERVVFNLGGNNFRLICKYFFGRKEIHLFICWVGSHSQYDKLCKENKQYTISVY